MDTVTGSPWVPDGRSPPPANAGSRSGAAASAAARTAPSSASTAAVRAPARAAASINNRSRTSRPTWTSESPTTSRRGSTSANSTTALPAFDRSGRVGIPDDVVDDVVEERGKLA